MAYDTDRMKVLSVKLPDELFLDISREAGKRNVSRSEVVRERLAAKRSSSPSLWERMEDLVVHEDSLPQDLSSNKKHMEKYGQNRAR